MASICNDELERFGGHGGFGRKALTLSAQEDEDRGLLVGPVEQGGVADIGQGDESGARTAQGHARGGGGTEQVAVDSAQQQHRKFPAVPGIPELGLLAGAGRRGACCS